MPRPWVQSFSLIVACGILAGRALSQTAVPAQPDNPTAAPAPQQPAVKPGSLPEVEIVFADGKRISGLLIDTTDDDIVLRVAGIDTKFPRKEITETRPLPSLTARYRILRDSIDNNDVERLIQLAEWLRSRQLYDEALIEIDRVLALEFDNPNAKDLRTLIVEQKKIADLPKRPTTPQGAAPNNARPVFPLLSKEQINLLRVFELDISNTKFTLKRDVIEKFTDTYADRLFRAFSAEERAMYIRSNESRIVKDMFALRAREFYPQIEVMDDPPSLRRFRDDVHTEWLSNSCATSQCHGGEDAGRLWLFARNAGSKEAVYTNFLILDRFRTTDGRPLIDFDKPSRSLLLQYGLPREDAISPHPKVENFGRNQKWRPVFSGEQDERFIAALEWIGSMTAPHVDYPIDYDPPRPRGGVAAQPDNIGKPQPR